MGPTPTLGGTEANQGGVSHPPVVVPRPTRVGPGALQGGPEALQCGHGAGVGWVGGSSFPCLLT